MRGGEGERPAIDSVSWWRRPWGRLIASTPWCGSAWRSASVSALNTSVRSAPAGRKTTFFLTSPGSSSRRGRSPAVLKSQVEVKRLCELEKKLRRLGAVKFGKRVLDPVPDWVRDCSPWLAVVDAYAALNDRVRMRLGTEAPYGRRPRVQPEFESKKPFWDPKRGSCDWAVKWFGT